MVTQAADPPPPSMPIYMRLGTNSFLIVFALTLIANANIASWRDVASVLAILFMAILPLTKYTAKWAATDERYMGLFALNAFADFLFFFVPGIAGWIALAAGIYCVALFIIQARRRNAEVA